MRLNSASKFFIAIGLSLSAGFAGSFFTAPAIGSGWYASLAKPALNPPSWVFAPVWTALYVLIGVSLFLVWRRNFKVVNHLWEKGHKAWNPLSRRLWTGDLKKFNIIAIFTVQYALNVFWSVAFFGLRSPGLALLVIIALFVSIVYLMVNFYRVSKAAAWLLSPYLLWVAFATYLNLSIFFAIM